MAQSSHLPRLQLLQTATALPSKRPPPWLALQHIIDGVRQGVHGFVHVILWSEVRQIHELSLCILQMFPSCAGTPSSVYLTCCRWCESALKRVLPKLLYLLHIQIGQRFRTITAPSGI